MADSKQQQLVFTCLTTVSRLTAEVKLGSVQKAGTPLPSVSFSISSEPLTRVLFDHLLLSQEIRQPVLIWQRRAPPGHL